MKLNETANVDVWRNSYSRQELEAMHRQLAKAANQRMVRLERSKSDITGEAFTFGAYDIATDYLEAKGRNRFSETKEQKDLDVFELKKEINVLQQFITSKSSRVGGMKEIEKERVSTFEAKGITFASNKEFYDFLNSNSFMYLSGNQKKKDGSWSPTIIDSDTIIDMYQKARDSGATAEQIQQALDDFRKSKGKKSEKKLAKMFNKLRLKNSRNN